MPKPKPKSSNGSFVNIIDDYYYVRLMIYFDVVKECSVGCYELLVKVVSGNPNSIDLSSSRGPKCEVKRTRIV